MSFDFHNFAKVLKHFKCDTLLDLGANDGTWAITAKHVLPSLKILCLEANPSCAEYLENKGLNYKIAALSDSVKKVKFYQNQENKICTGVSYYKENSQHYDEKLYFEMETTTLDSLLPDQSFDAIKLDTQGSELDILRGGSNILSNIKVLVIEASYTNYNVGAPMYQEITQFMQNSGFQYIGLIGNSKDPQGEVIQEDMVFARKSLLGGSQ